MARVRVKICGITRLTDALAAVRAGADAIGLVFYPQSPRYIDIQAAARLAAQLPPFITKVALFVNAEPAYIRQVLAEVPLDLLQFHGAENEADCTGYAKPYIKAIPVAEETDIVAEIAKFPAAAGILLDAYVPDRAGGTGQMFDWHRIPAQPAKPLILAGGLHAGNVAEAVRRIAPYALDVSSGVESAKGVKSIEKIEAFISAVDNDAPN